MSTVESPADSARDAFSAMLKRLESELAASLIGLPYLFARSSYGNELTVHFGSERKHGSAKLAGKVRGSHILSFRGSAWMLQSGIQPVVVGCGIAPITAEPVEGRPFNTTALESGALIGMGAVVTRAMPFLFEPINAVGLKVDLNDGSSFMVVPTAPVADDSRLPEPADWEFLTPTKKLQAGPGCAYKVEEFGAHS